MHENPLLAGLGLPREPQPLTLVIFGASGDLTRRKLIPALFSLYLKGSITGVKIVGFARREWDTPAFRALVRTMLDSEDSPAGGSELKDAFASGVSFVRSSFESPRGYAEISTNGAKPFNRIFYLATPPDAYQPIVDRIGAA
jgi:glucose-6-phosphate 1-dehydrogenase